jgi:hypothetical protein
LPDMKMARFLSSLWVGIFDRNIEHLAKILTQAMGRSALDSTAVGWDISLASCRIISSSKFLLLCLSPTNDWDSQQIFINLGI